MPKKGEKPGKGTYICQECGAEQTLRKETETLQGCVCEGTEFREKGGRKPVGAKK
ncbi:MAG: hypothetical protein M0Z48_10735 [Nitrospiraceae bacterium]|nr:hypothetical protein [Nitrospiraceae bacterium]